MWCTNISVIIVQDGASPHTTDQVLDFLDDEFAGKVLSFRSDLRRGDGGQRGGHEWSPRSPDMSVLDFFFFHELRNKVFAHPRPTSLPELEQKIKDAYDDIDHDMIRRAFLNVPKRAQLCVQEGDGHFEK